MNEGIQITTGQVIVAAVALFGTLGTLLKIIQSQYQDRIKSSDARVEDVQSVCDKRIADASEAHKGTMDHLESRIAWLEARDEQWRVQQQQYVQTLEQAVDVQRTMTEALDALAKQATARRRSTSGR